MRATVIEEAGLRRARPRVVYWNNIPAPYMVERFNAVANRGNVDLEAWFSRRVDRDRSWTVDESNWRFRFRFLRRIGIARMGMSIPSSLLLGPRPDLLVSLYAEPEFVGGWLAAKARGVKTAFWAEVTFDSWVRRRRYREWLKRWMFRHVDGIITPGEDGRSFARRYGASVQRIRIVRQPVDVDHFANGSRMTRAERDRRRAELGLAGTVFIYVGRLWRPKGIFDLADAFAAARATGVDASLLLIGDGVDEEALRAHISRLRVDRVLLAGFHQREELPAWYGLADALVFPTHGDPYGMVVDEGMACGLPILTSRAAGELADRVHDGKNGYIVPPANVRGLAAAMALLASDAALRHRMGEESHAMIKGHSPERWAEDFEQAVAGILAQTASPLG